MAGHHRGTRITERGGTGDYANQHSVTVTGEAWHQGPYWTTNPNLINTSIMGPWQLVQAFPEPEAPGDDPDPDPDPVLGRATFTWTRSISTDVTSQTLEVLRGGAIVLSRTLAPGTESYQTTDSEHLPVGSYMWRVITSDSEGLSTPASGPAFAVVAPDPDPDPDPIPPNAATGLDVTVEIVE
jgi:hypothetical protein